MIPQNAFQRYNQWGVHKGMSILTWKQKNHISLNTKYNSPVAVHLPSGFTYNISAYWLKILVKISQVLNHPESTTEP